MFEINRSLMVVRPQQPFLDWVKSLDESPEDLKLEDVQEDCSSYLVPECESFEERMAVILWCWDVVFEEELFSWYSDKDLWPADRTPEMFIEWFDLEFHSVVNDLVDDPPLERIEYDTANDSTSSNGNTSSSNVH